MTFPIEQYLTDTNKGKKGFNTPEYIIFHFVGASGQAMDNAKYFKSVYRGASAHYFVDPNTIVQVVEDDTPAWHIGDGSVTGKGAFNGYVIPGGATNSNSIGVELCQDTSTGDDVWHWDFHPDTIERAEWLIRKLQVEHNIDDGHVIRHHDASGKMCPGNWQYDDWAKWWAFKDRLEKDLIQPTPSATPKPEDNSTDLEGHMYIVEPGDTLYSIATSHGVKVDDLIKWNTIANPDLILPDTKLFISEPKSAAAVSENDLKQMATDVINGKYGDGEERKQKLGDNYQAVQAIVNDMAKPKGTIPPASAPKPAEKTIDQLATEVLRGAHGSGRERMISLGSNYAKVQAEVNRRLRNK